MASTSNNHSCDNFSEKVVMYLDGELKKQDEALLLQEMRQCKHCLEKYSREKSFREFIKRKVNNRKVSPTLIKSIKDQIQLSSILK